MNQPEVNPQPRYYFALPRLLASQFGGNSERTESNWWEANLVGGLAHLIWYVFACEILLVRLRLWEKLILLVPLAFLVWVCWLIALYLDSVLIRCLRLFGFLRELTNARAQSVLLGLITTAFACQLVASGSRLGVLGLIWVAAVSLNLLAAAVFVVRDALASAD